MGDAPPLTDVEHAPTPWRRLRWPGVAVLATCLAAVSFPGAIPFVYDEPLLILAASGLNSQHRLATFGLIGSMGRPYGPVPTWFYQGCLLVTHDLVAVSAIHAACFMLATGFAAVWIARSARLWGWGALLVVGSPYVWFYGRLLWDNPMVIPLGMLSVACYAAFLRKPRGGLLAGCAVLAVLACMAHLMALTLPAGLALHAATRSRRQAWAYRSHLALGVVVGLAIAAPYLVYFVHSGNPPPAHPLRASNVTYVLFGPRSLSGVGLDELVRAPADDTGAFFWRSRTEYLHVPGAWSAALAVASAGTVGIFLFFWAGLVTVPLSLLRRGVARSDPVALELAALSLYMLAALFALNVATGITGSPSYYSGTMPAYAILAWVTLDALVRRGRAFALLACAHLACLLATTALLFGRLAQTGGTRTGNYGITLGNQVEIAREINRYDPASPARYDVTLVGNSIVCINAICGEKVLPPGPRLSARPLVVRYTSDDTSAGWAEVVPRDAP